MTGKTITLALALLVGATAIAAAQSQRNYGGNGPSSYGCYGSFYTGTAASSCPGTPEGGPWAQQYQPYPQQPQYPHGGNGSGSDCIERLQGTSWRHGRLFSAFLGDRTMTATRIIVALVLLVGATSIASAQSQRNFGPNGPSRSDCFGEPHSGAVASHCPGQGGYWHHARHHYY